MELYKHTVAYYETDKMGITHHSNYIRWMEEARVDFMDKIGYSYKKLEDMGIISPVTAVNCSYKNSTTFGDTVYISVKIKELRPAKVTLSYSITNTETGEQAAAAESSHAFLKKGGGLLRLKKEFPDFYHAMEMQIES